MLSTSQPGSIVSMSLPSPKTSATDQRMIALTEAIRMLIDGDPGSDSAASRWFSPTRTIQDGEPLKSAIDLNNLLKRNSVSDRSRVSDGD